MAEAVFLHQHALPRPDQALQPVRPLPRAGLAQPAGAFLRDGGRDLGHARGGVPRFGEKGKMWPMTMSHSSTSRSDVSAISSVSVGKPAIRSAPIAISGRLALSRATVSTASRATVAPLHPLQDHVVAGLEAHMEVRHEARLAGGQLEQALVHLDAVERGEAQPRQLGHVPQDPLDQLAEASARRAGRGRSW